MGVHLPCNDASPHRCAPTARHTDPPYRATPWNALLLPLRTTSPFVVPRTAIGRSLNVGRKRHLQVCEQHTLHTERINTTPAHTLYTYHYTVTWRFEPLRAHARIYYLPTHIHHAHTFRRCRHTFVPGRPCPACSTQVLVNHMGGWKARAFQTGV